MISTYPNWFESQMSNFETSLSDMKGQPNLMLLQIGVYTGDASEWLLQNVLTDPTSYLLDVDTWEGSDESEHSKIDFEKVYEFYKKRMEPYPNVRSARNNSDNFFRSNAKPIFDFIYIDGDHTSHQVTKDADGGWKALKPGGIMAFDDYMWGQDMAPELTPKPAIDRFLAKYWGEYQMLTRGYQVWIRKNDN